MKKSNIYKKVLATIMASTMMVPQTSCKDDKPSIKEATNIIYETPNELDMMRLEQYKSQIEEQGANINVCNIFYEDLEYIYIKELVIEEHKVKENETIESLITKYSMDRMKFMEINEMEDEKLKKNEKVNVYYYNLYNLNKFETDYELHKCSKDETLTIIARFYECTVEELIEINPQIKNPNLIEIGQYIRVPKLKENEKQK